MRLLLKGFVQTLDRLQCRILMNSDGTVVFGGMIASTFLANPFVPVFM
jgi:multidrug efflux pump subunit AcrB